MSQMRDLLVDVATELFARGADPEVQESVEAGVFPQALWREIDENGLPSALLAEDQGGAGLSLGDAMAVLRVAGAFALPLPLAETMFGRALLAQCGLGAPEGPLSLLLGAPGQPLVWEDNGKSLSVSGTATGLWLEASTSVALAVEPAQVGRDDRVALLQSPALGAGTVEVRPNLAGEPRFRRVLEAEIIGPEDWARAPVGFDCVTLQSLTATARSALLAGAMERVLDLTLEHARGRVQFGRPIGRFQAVQQQIAVMAGEVAAVGVAADAAARATERDGAAFAVAAAKARASEAAAKVAHIAHQIHGAIGFTREHALHRFTRRLWTWRDDYGDETYWQSQAGKLALAAGEAGLWDLLCDGEATGDGRTSTPN